ncbi:sel1 repeat family protein [Polynucleobacter sp. MWH-Spelu-300-X4]|uniref:tetratricopeptide repeat protein n=1 Tax=Polynucleobacter sp. MWH-Spelu-300-X4 TaxID=2689109 RepID=UPI001BFD9950|nr:SEL1-like repeat protein [Polynucleobacter sp. MWH-Spelu-300-X4]QWD79871.1 sel1 repeat family protein [Polynucleobacter sp. MWH-Spelu-300-X4]
MKNARSGDAFAQQKIGEIYLFGEPGTPKNISNALLWLEKYSITTGFIRDISNLIVSNLALDDVLSKEQAKFAWKCIVHSASAGQTLARWLFTQVIFHLNTSGQSSYAAFNSLITTDWSEVGSLDDMFGLALRYLEELADLDSFEDQIKAQKLLAQCLDDGRLGKKDPERSKKIMLHLAKQNNEVGLASLLSLASSSVGKELLPALEIHLPTLLGSKKHLAEHTLIYWAAWQHLQNIEALEIAAELGFSPAQLTLGLRLAKLEEKNSSLENTSEVSETGGNARLKQAVYWLKLAAKKGDRDAWFALGLINRMPQYSGYSAEDSDACFDKAADLGHPQAQYRKGSSLWRKRAQIDEAIEGLQASYWVWQASQQGITEAQELLSKIMLSCPNASLNRWNLLANAVIKTLGESSHRFTGDMLLTCHRVIVANQLNLSKAELLLADIPSIQHEHGAVIDIREHSPRSTPKLIQIETLEQRKALMMASKSFANAFSNSVVDEGNLRQRRYRLEKLMQSLDIAEDGGSEDDTDE